MIWLTRTWLSPKWDQKPHTTDITVKEHAYERALIGLWNFPSEKYFATRLRSSKVVWFVLPIAKARVATSFSSHATLRVERRWDQKPSGTRKKWRASRLCWNGAAMTGPRQWPGRRVSTGRISL